MHVLCCGGCDRLCRMPTLLQGDRSISLWVEASVHQAVLVAGSKLEFQLAFVGSVNILLAVGNEEVASLLVVGRRDCVAHQVLANCCSACWVLYHSACVRVWNVVSACASMQVYLGQCCVLPFVAQHACTQLQAADFMCCDIAHVSSVLV